MVFCSCVFAARIRGLQYCLLYKNKINKKLGGGGGLCPGKGGFVSCCSVFFFCFFFFFFRALICISLLVYLVSVPYVCVLSFDNGEKKDVNEFAGVVLRATALRNDWPSRQSFVEAFKRVRFRLADFVG